DEIRRDRLPTRVIGFTGGEPFMNPEITPMLEEVLSRGFEALVLTNAMKPMAKAGASLLAIRSRYGEQLTVRVSIDHYSASIHDLERGTRTWQSTLAGLTWLLTNGFKVHV